MSAVKTHDVSIEDISVKVDVEDYVRYEAVTFHRAYMAVEQWLSYSNSLFDKNTASDSEVH